jgi:hypothetical protein
MPMRLLAWALLGGHASAAWAGPELTTEKTVDEARARPVAVSESGSWVTVPIPVANPTVGNGLQVAVLYLHPQAAGEDSAPATTSGVVAMGTDRKTRLFAAFHDGSLSNDRYRISAFGGFGDFNLRFYGVGNQSPFADNPVPYRVKGALVQLRAEARLPGTEHWFAGATYQYLDSTFTLQASQATPGLPDVPVDFKSAGFGPHLSFDTRDSNYFPTSGRRFRIGWLNFGPTWGGRFSFDKVDAFYNHYVPFSDASVLALRARFQAASDETPFLFLPVLDMRGFSRDRYRDNRALSLTAEWRQKLAARWGFAAYGEAGRIASSFDELAQARTITTLGAGVRWQATADRDLHVGIDVAVSTDDRALFIQIGERF